MSGVYDWNSSHWQQLLDAEHRLPHALLFCGPPGVGKADFARALAKRLLCATAVGTAQACGNCDACRLFELGNHPDFLSVLPARLEAEEGTLDEEGEAVPADKSDGKAKSDQIRIEQIRQVTQQLTIGSHQGGRRVVLVRPAEAMNTATANALLKVLEEPPSATLFLLVTDRPRRLLPTLRSRCQVRQFSRPDSEQALSWLGAHGVQDAATLLALCGGSPLAARDLAGSAQAHVQGQMLDDLAGRAIESPLEAAARWYGWLEGKKGEAGAVNLATLVSWMQLWLADLTLYMQTGQTRVFDSRRSALQALSQRVGLTAVLACYNELLRYRAVSQHPLNARLFLEDVLMRYARIFMSGRPS